MISQPGHVKVGVLQWQPHFSKALPSPVTPQASRGKPVCTLFDHSVERKESRCGYSSTKWLN
ncbi:hypothetical protein E2C01_004689 [Portunus trituberculatus]|uniref:Uncharacterized protein n=1 Tax=Portunus trituberculatus TaxID=210409 RepID=A0A5B7CQM5_PORTR|nr:hypothetical protein [Portunus trituberculatus]